MSRLAPGLPTMIVLLVEANKTGSGKIRFTLAFWLVRTAGAATARPIQTTSRVPDASPEELDALAEGRIYETVIQGGWWNSNQEAKDEAVALLTQYQADLDKQQTRTNGLSGIWWDGTQWNNPAQPFTERPLNPPPLGLQLPSSLVRPSSEAAVTLPAAKIDETNALLRELIDYMKERC